VDCSDGNTAAIKTNGTLWIWGSSTGTILGQEPAIIAGNVPSPIQVGTSTNWKEVRVSVVGHAAALKTDGTLWAWGNNGYLQLGLGDATNRSIPTQVGSLTNWKQVDTADFSIHAIKTDGTLWSWGSNSQGQLGLGDAIQRSSPVQVGTLTNWKQVSGRGSNVYAIKTDGTLWAWGNNGNGQLGLNDGAPRSSPVQVGSLTNWKYVAQSTAIKTDGTLWTWGGNSQGELGLGDLINRSSPVQVGSLNNWKQVSQGNSYNISAIKTDGTLWTWGGSIFGPLSSPVQVGSLTNWKYVASSIGTVAIQAPDYNVDVPYAAWNTNTNLTAAMNSFTIGAIASNDNTFIAVSSSNARAARSTDGGLTWSNLPAVVTATGNLSFFRGIAYGAGKWVAVGYNTGDNSGALNGAYSTDDGVTWTAISNIQTATPTRIRFVNGIFVICGLSDFNSYSNDGVTWTSNVVAGGGYNMNDIAYGNSTYAMVGQTGTVLYGSSITGLTRIVQAIGGSLTANFMTGVAFGNGIFIAVGVRTDTYVSVAFSSTNGSTWTALSNFPSVSSGAIGNFGNLNITFDGAKFIVGGKAGFAYSSINGTTWTNESTLTTAMTTGDINSIAVSSRRLIMAGGSAGKAARYAP
jgi:alpha-tubulin suppressor-like RCC1 family protein